MVEVQELRWSGGTGYKRVCAWPSTFILCFHFCALIFLKVQVSICRLNSFLSGKVCPQPQLPCMNLLWLLKLLWSLHTLSQKSQKYLTFSWTDRTCFLRLPLCENCPWHSLHEYLFFSWTDRTCFLRLLLCENCPWHSLHEYLIFLWTPFIWL